METATESFSFKQENFFTKYYEKDDHTMETFHLDGKYAIANEYINKATEGATDYDDFERVENCKAVYFCGNILYKTDEPKIWEYIDLIIEATFKTNLPVSVDKSVRTRKQMVGGTICPTRDVIFAYDGKLFILYGRYIYGYNNRYVRFVNEKPKKVEDSIDDDDDSNYEDEDEDEDEYKKLPASLSNEEIVLPVVPYETKNKLNEWLNDYNYSFAILDKSTNTLLAFSLYR